MSSTYESILDTAIYSGLSQLKNLSNAELNALLEDNNKLEGLVKDLPHVKNLLSEKHLLLAQNKSAAEYNLSLEGPIRQGREKLQATYEEACRVRNEAEAKKRELESLASQRSVDTTLALLQTAAAEAKEESEKVSSSLLDGSVNVETFLDQYAEKRFLAHMREIKAEKLAEVTRNGSQQPSRQSYPAQSGTGDNYARTVRR